MRHILNPFVSSVVETHATRLSTLLEANGGADGWA